MRTVWWGAVALVLVGGLDAVAADPTVRRPTVRSDGKLDTHLRPRVAAPASRGSSLSPPAAPRRASSSTSPRPTRPTWKPSAAPASASTASSRKHNLVRGRIRKKDLRRLAALDVVRSVSPSAAATSAPAPSPPRATPPRARRRHAPPGFDGTGDHRRRHLRRHRQRRALIISGDLPPGRASRSRRARPAPQGKATRARRCSRSSTTSPRARRSASPRASATSSPSSTRSTASATPARR